MAMDTFGRYEILEELGSGAMGTVYRARDPKIGRIVAIKTIRAFGARPGEDDEYRQRFFREAQAAGNLSHPGIVTIFDVGEGEAAQTPYIVMEYIAGRTLESHLSVENNQPLSPDTSIDLVRQLAEALDYAHAQNIVHRDIKPANILVTPEGRAKITDFGVARLTHSEFTVRGQLIGTPAYMSPEQLKGDPADGRSDLFSLGVILYWLLTGEKPFAGDATSAIAKILYRDPDPVTRFNPSLGAEYDRVVNRALAKDPAARYQRGNEFAKDLSSVRLGAAPPLPPIPSVEAPKTNRLFRGAARHNALEKTVLLNPSDSSAEPTADPASHPTGGNRRKILVTAAMAAIGLSALLGFSALLLRPKSKPALAAHESPATPKKETSKWNVLSARKTSETAPARKASDTAAFQILCWHDFDSANLSVWVANTLVYETKLKSGRRLSGYLSAAAYAPPGKHVVRVQIISERGAYDQVRTIDADLAEGKEKTLEITCDELKGELNLAWQN